MPSSAYHLIIPCSTPPIDILAVAFGVMQECEPKHHKIVFNAGCSHRPVFTPCTGAVCVKIANSLQISRTPIVSDVAQTPAQRCRICCRATKRRSKSARKHESASTVLAPPSRLHKPPQQGSKLRRNRFRAGGRAYLVNLAAVRMRLAVGDD